jgi:SOS response regulatory protein OraA/RecX
LGQDDDESLQKEVQKYKNRYNLSDPKEVQKFYAALLRKGFNYSDIKNAIIVNEE